MVGEVVCQDWGQVVSCFGSVECMGLCRKCVGSMAFCHLCELGIGFSVFFFSWVYRLLSKMFCISSVAIEFLYGME